MITTMLKEVQTEFVHLREEAEQNRQTLRQLVELQRQLVEQAEAKSRTTELTADTKSSAVQSNESWLHWIGRTTYVIGVYRYFVPQSGWHECIFSDIEFI